jgi:hypothetical protein
MDFIVFGTYRDADMKRNVSTISVHQNSILGHQVVFDGY